MVGQRRADCQEAVPDMVSEPVPVTGWVSVALVC